MTATQVAGVLLLIICALVAVIVRMVDAEQRVRTLFAEVEARREFERAMQMGEPKHHTRPKGRL